MTATNARDRETVRALLHQHLPSGFPRPLGPLTVGSVACRLYNEWQMGRLPLFVWEKPIIDRLLTSTTPLPADLTDETVQAALRAAFDDATVSVDSLFGSAFVGLFREAIDGLILERSRNFVPPHPRAF